MNSQRPLAKQVIAECQDLQSPAVVEVDPLIFQWPETVQALESLGYFVPQIEDALIATKNDLLKALDEACDFPDYFGFNWDALLDCLSDFHWHPAKGYILVFENPKGLNQGDLKLFLEVAQEANRRWASRGIPFKLLVSKGSVKAE